MRSSLLKLFSSLCVVMISACGAVEERPQPETVPAVNPLAFGACVFSSNTPTEVSGKLHVYDAMARAAKYNSLTLAQTMQKKIYS